MVNAGLELLWQFSEDVDGGNAVEGGVAQGGLGVLMVHELFDDVQRDAGITVEGTV